MADAFGHALAYDVEHGLEESEDEYDLELEGESMAGNVFGPITSLITLPPHNSNAEEFDQLLNDLRQRILKELGKSKKTKEAIQLMMSSFDMAKRLIPFADEPKKQLRALDKFITDLTED